MTDNRFPHAHAVIERAQQRIPHLAGALVRQDVEALVELAREQADELDRIGRARLALAAVRLIATESVTEDAGLLRRAILDQLPAGVVATPDVAAGHETDPEPGPELGEHGTCAALVGRGAEGTGVCGHEIQLREERTALMADGTDGHGQPGGRLVRVWRHTDAALDYMHRAQIGGPA